MARRVGDSVVVITGASSGIGRAIALRLAGRGAAVVLAARREDVLDEVVQECERLGGLALAVPTDVTDEDAVTDLARRAIETYGRIDAWVNNAGVYVAGPFEEIPVGVWRRVLETNVLGTVHGCRAALPFMREQGAGVIVNVASLLGAIGMPNVTPYVASKFAVRGFSASLRMELLGTPVEVATILPGAIDTPLWDHSANYAGKALQPPRPIHDPELVARAIEDAIESPSGEVFVPASGRAIVALDAVGGRLFERAMSAVASKSQFADREVDETAGNLFEPMEEGTAVSGGWRIRERPRSPLLTLGALAALAGSAALAWAFATGRVPVKKRSATRLLETLGVKG